MRNKTVKEPAPTGEPLKKKKLDLSQLWKNKRLRPIAIALGVVILAGIVYLILSLTVELGNSVDVLDRLRDPVYNDNNGKEHRKSSSKGREEEHVDVMLEDLYIIVNVCDHYEILALVISCSYLMCDYKELVVFSAGAVGIVEVLVVKELLLGIRDLSFVIMGIETAGGDNYSSRGVHDVDVSACYITAAADISCKKEIVLIIHLFDHEAYMLCLIESGINVIGIF